MRTLDVVDDEWSPLTEPGSEFGSPSPIEIDAGEPWSVSCTKRISSVGRSG